MPPDAFLAHFHAQAASCDLGVAASRVHVSTVANAAEASGAGAVFAVLVAAVVARVPAHEAVVSIAHCY